MKTNLLSLFQFLVEHFAAFRVVVPLLAVIFGIILCMVGGRLARPTCAVCGLCLGMAGGFLASQQFVTDHWLAAWVLGGALLGGLFVWALFRLWMGIGLAVVMAMVLPAAILTLQHQTPPLAPRTMIAWHPSSLENSPNETVSGTHEQSTTEQTPQNSESNAVTHLTAEHELAITLANLRPGLAQQRSALGKWWREEISADCKRLLWVVVMLGAAVGLVVGLALPGMAARIETSTLGAFLLLLGLRELVMSHLPSYRSWWVPANPTTALIALGLITITGVFMQWTLRRRPTDK